MVKTCKCHGVSGSCTMKTCWRTLPAFNIIGDHLTARYSHAKHVVPSSSTKKYRQLSDEPSKSINSASSVLLVKKQKNIRSHNANMRSNDLEPKSRDLVFLDTSPNYCESNTSFDSLGTIGRQCNRSLESFDSCKTMCCGRGNYSLVMKLVSFYAVVQTNIYLFVYRLQHSSIHSQMAM